MNWRVRIVSLTAALALAACAPSAEQAWEDHASAAVDSTTESLVGEANFSGITGRYWGNGSFTGYSSTERPVNVDVCYATPGYWAYKAEMEAFVKKVYNDTTNLRVRFFGDCSGTSQTDMMRIEFKNGTDDDRSNSKTGWHWGYHSTATFFVNDSRKSYVWLHELGHGLGFAHEQNRRGSACTSSPKTGQGVPHGPYDPFSVMNYCNGSSAKSLTDLDLQGIAYIYGAPGTFARDRSGAVYRHWKARRSDGSSYGTRCYVTSPEQLDTFNGVYRKEASGARGRFPREEDMYQLGDYDLGPCAYPPGFYDIRGAVYYVLGDNLGEHSGTVCHVGNESQMESFGGFQLVRNRLPASTNLWQGRESRTMASTPQCAWGDGYYARDGTVYFLSRGATGPNLCQVETPQQLNALQRVGEGSQETGSYHEYVEPFVLTTDAAHSYTSDANLAQGRFLPPGGIPRCTYPAGYYADGARIYKLEGTSFCHVQNPTQLAALQPSYIRDISREPFMWSAPYAFAGECKWPDGLYRQGAKVYALGSPAAMPAAGQFRLPHISGLAFDPVRDVCALVNDAQRPILASALLEPRYTVEPIAVPADSNLTVGRTLPAAIKTVPSCPWPPGSYMQTMSSPAADSTVYDLQIFATSSYDGSVSYRCSSRSSSPPATVWPTPDPVYDDIWPCPIPAARAPRLLLTCSTTPCTTGSVLTATFEGLPGFETDYVTIVPDGAPFEPRGPFVYTYGANHGAATFAPPGWGTFVARTFVKDSGVLRSTSAPITVVAPSSDGVTLSCSDTPCSETSTLTVSFVDLPDAPNNGDGGVGAYAIGLARFDAPPCDLRAYQSWDGRVSRSGSVSFSASAAMVGGLVARVSSYFSCNSVLGQSVILPVVPTVSVTCSTTPCLPNSSTLTVAFANLPGHATDWIALTPIGEPATRGIGNWLYTGGIKTGTVTFPAGEVGFWVARAFANDSFVPFGSASVPVYVGVSD